MNRVPAATILLGVVLLCAYDLELASGANFCEAHGFSPDHPTLATAAVSPFLHHPTDWSHILGNLFALLCFGSLVEWSLGAPAMLAVFLAGAVGGVLGHWLAGSDTLVGASGAITGLMAAAATVRPRWAAFVATWGAANAAALLGVPRIMPAGASAACHVGGLAAGFLAALVLKGDR